MDISVINEVPAKRLPIKNCVVGTAFRPKAYSFIEEQVRAGHQAYVICPLVEETENSEGENVTDYANVLKAALPKDITVDVLNGRMKSKAKDEVMQRFANNESQVLVSTTVVEVGVNVPNATVMMIENADRFGLAQLHQLRGRVGRGDAQSYCIFINSSNSKKSKKRLEILNKSNDGFYIASEDLKLRGPGDFFGIRQSGDLAFALADVYQDSDVLKEASEMVDEVLEADPALCTPENRILKKKMDEFIDKIDLQTVSMQTLAFIGDAVYNVYIRSYLAAQNNRKTGLLHRDSIKYVSAKGQSSTIDKIMDILSEEEIDVYKRGRNTSIHSVSKNVDVIEYKKSTGFEALIGYLYVKRDIKRLDFLVSECIKCFD